MHAHPHDVSGEWFDFVIIGGGTAGLALASRLSEDTAVSVVVIEAGEPNLGDPNILVPAQFGRSFTNLKYDWAFPTEKQIYSNGKEYIWSRGKGLGGSSALNFYAWSKPPAVDVDAIEKLGNPGWNWNEYLKYSKRSETFHPPSEKQMTMYPHTHDPGFRGTMGPIQTTIPFHYHGIDTLFQQTMTNKGLKNIPDPYGGDINGTWIASANLDRKTWTRSYASTGYLLPAQNRSNLTVLTESTVTRILFNETAPGELLTANGVEFVHNTRLCQAYAKREVILSAGTIQSPQILELSGIGRPDVLHKIGVDVKIELEGVGENVQDHTYFGVSFELAGTPETYDRLQDPGYAAEALKTHATDAGYGPQSAGITSFAYFPLSAATPDASALIGRAAADLSANKTLPPGLQEQLDIQLAALRDDSSVDLEIVAFPGYFTKISTPEAGKSYVTMLAVLNHPLSRGSIHSKSGDPFEHPSIDPRYFENDFDLEILVQHVKYIRSMLVTEPFKSAIVREVDPGAKCVTDEEIREYIKETHGTSWHTVGSCSMLPKEKRGVVDATLKVYGTSNLRVVDISIIPLHIAAHTQATAYVIAEKAADLIRSNAVAGSDS